MHFVGSKGGAGVKEWLISAMPAHRVYVEPFLGKGVVLKNKLPAAVSIGIDYDRGTLASWHSHHQQPGTSIVHGDALQLLPVLKVESDWLIYADPPYLGTARSCQRRYYAHELFTEAAHERLLSVLIALPGMVMISGYRSELYCRRLAGWRLETFWTIDRRRNRKEECLWLNFPAPTVMHDARHVGKNFTDRQRVKRKVARWSKKFLAMPPAERQRILEALHDAKTDSTIAATARPE